MCSESMGPALWKEWLFPDFLQTSLGEVIHPQARWERYIPHKHLSIIG